MAARPGSLAPDLYGDLKLSPEGRRLAVSIDDPRTGSSDLWIVDLERAVPSRLTSSPRSEMVARWSPDGQSLAFSAADWQGPPNVYLQDLAGGPPRVLVPFDRRQQYPWAWTPDGARLVYSNRDEASKHDLWITDRDGAKRERLLATEFAETEAALSPDGRVMAFASDVTGAREIYLQSFPGGKAGSGVSTGRLLPALPGRRTGAVLRDALGRTDGGLSRSRRLGPRGRRAASALPLRRGRLPGL